MAKADEVELESLVHKAEDEEEEGEVRGESSTTEQTFAVIEPSNIENEEEQAQDGDDDDDDEDVEVVWAGPWWRLDLWSWLSLFRLVTALVCIILLTLAFVFLPVNDILMSAIEWIKNLGAAGGVVFVLLLCIWILSGLPSTVAEVAGAVIFGFWLGLLFGTIGKNVGSIGAFLIGRALGRRFIRRYVLGRVRGMKALFTVMKNNSIRMVALVRIAYLPMALKNYGLSIFDISLKVFISVSFVCGIPFSIVWAYLGSSTEFLMELLNGGSVLNENPYALALTIAGIVFAVVFFVIVSWLVRREWQRALTTTTSATT